MRLPVASHMVTTSYIGSKLGPSDELTPTLDCIEGIYEKVLDGRTWMSMFDGHPRSIANLVGVASRVMEHNAQGRSWVPWANVRCLDVARVEGELAGVIARTAHEAQTPSRQAAFIPTFIANVEPYEQFWPWREAESREKAEQWVQGYAQSGGKALWMWIDARQWQLSEDAGIGLANWKRAAEREGLVFQVLPETYWTAFSGSLASAEPALLEMVSNLSDYDIEPRDIMPTLPGDAEPHDMVRAILLCKELGLGRPNIWQRMNLRLDTAAAIAAMVDPWGESSEGVPAAPGPNEGEGQAEAVPSIDAIREAAQGVAEAAQKLAEALR